MIGVPDERSGEVPKAFVVKAEGSDIDQAKIISALAEQLAPYKVPSEVEFIAAIPKSGTGKILRRQLK